jgi:hypothetical protein
VYALTSHSNMNSKALQDVLEVLTPPLFINAREYDGPQWSYSSDPSMSSTSPAAFFLPSRTVLAREFRFEPFVCAVFIAYFIFCFWGKAYNWKIASVWYVSSKQKQKTSSSHKNHAKARLPPPPPLLPILLPSQQRTRLGRVQRLLQLLHRPPVSTLYSPSAPGTTSFNKLWSLTYDVPRQVLGLDFKLLTTPPPPTASLTLSVPRHISTMLLALPHLVQTRSKRSPPSLPTSTP